MKGSIRSKGASTTLQIMLPELEYQRKKWMESRNKLQKLQLSRNQEKVAQQCFTLLDINGDGEIEYSEIISALREIGVNTDEKELYASFSHFDADQSGTIDYEEFAQIMFESAFKHDTKSSFLEKNGHHAHGARGHHGVADEGLSNKTMPFKLLASVYYRKSLLKSVTEYQMVDAKNNKVMDGTSSLSLEMMDERTKKAEFDHSISIYREKLRALRKHRSMLSGTTTSYLGKRKTEELKIRSVLQSGKNEERKRRPSVTTAISHGCEGTHTKKTHDRWRFCPREGLNIRGQIRLKLKALREVRKLTSVAPL